VYNVDPGNSRQEGSKDPQVVTSLEAMLTGRESLELILKQQGRPSFADMRDKSKHQAEWVTAGISFA
jgi:hypothetical protein